MERSGFVRGLTIALATWGIYFCVLWSGMLFERSDGLYAGWRTLWADWVAHFAYANVFAYWPVSDWFASHPLFATAGFDYPFLVDGFSGLLMRGGIDRITAFIVPSLIASLVFVGVLFSFYALIFRSSGWALFACTLFFTNGGLGFLDFASQFARNPSLDLLLLPPREYTYFPKQDIWWINIVSSEMLPQRALLVGMPIALAVLIVLFRCYRSGFEGVSNLKLCGLGLLSSLLVVTHMHSFLALVALCTTLFLFDLGNTRRWLVFAGAAGLPSLVLFSLLYGGVGSRGFLEWYPGWLTNPAAGHQISLWLFLWLNWGVFLPLAAVSILRFRYYRDPLVVGGIVLFVACFLVRFQPNTWDNTKLLTWSHLLLCVPVTHYLLHLWGKRGVSRFMAVGLIVFTTASGFLELWRITRPELAVRMWTRDEMVLAERLRGISSPDAIVLCSDHHHHWVAGLSGRRVLLGYRGWLGSYGIDYSSVERDVKTMLQGGPDAEDLIDRYGVDFVAIGRSERRDFGADEGYFDRQHELKLQGAGYKVFGVSTPVGSGAP